MLKREPIAGLLIFGLMLLAGCINAGPSVEAFEGTSWVLTSLNGSSPLEDATITLNFEDETVGGDAGCNSYGGDYLLSGETDVTISNLVSTLRACADPELGEQETAYLRILGGVTGYNLSASQLELFNDAGETLIFTPN